jgi:predicted anti-sigma-YlaC factor YlaD
MVHDACFAVQDLMKAYLSGAVQPETAEWMESHLLTCPVCAGKKEAMERKSSITRRGNAKVRSAGNGKPETEQEDIVLPGVMRQFNRMHIGLLLMAGIIFLHLLPWVDYGGDAVWFLQYTLPGLFITLFVLAFSRYNLPGAIMATLLAAVLPLGACEFLRHSAQYAGDLETFTITQNYWMMLGAALLLTGITLVHIWREPLRKGIRFLFPAREQ